MRGPGVYDDLSNEEYHSDRGAISNTELGLLAKSPAHLKWARENPKKSSPSKDIGKAVHTIVLEPHLMKKYYAVVPENAPTRPSSRQRNADKPSDATRKAIAWWDDWQADNQGKEIVTAEKYQDISDIAAAIRNNPVARKILEDAVSFEQSVYAEEFETGILRRCRPDIRIPNWLYDVKSTRDARACQFAYSCRNYRYNVQATWYQDICNDQGLDIEGFGFIAVDAADRPYQCTVFHRLSDKAMEDGRKEYMNNLRLYAECLEKDEWPGYPSEYDVLDLAGYAYDIESEVIEIVEEFA